MAKSTQLKEVEDWHYGDEFENAGFEDATGNYFLTPMLDILHFSSAEISQDGFTGRPGDLIIRTLGEVYSGKKGVIFVPCYPQERYVEWRPKDQGGGIAGQYGPDDPYVAEIRERNNGKVFGKLTTSGVADDKTSNNLSQTFYLFGIMGVVNDDPEDYSVQNTRPLVIPFSSTKIRSFKRLMTQAKVMLPRRDGTKYKAPLFAHRYRVKTTLVKDEGYQWFIYDTNFDGANAVEARIRPNDPILDEAKQLYQLVKDNQVKPDTRGVEQDAPAEGYDGGYSRNSGPKAGSEDIPF